MPQPSPVQYPHTAHSTKTCRRWARNLALLLSLWVSAAVMAQNIVLPDGSIRGTPRTEAAGVAESVADIQTRAAIDDLKPPSLALRDELRSGRRPKSNEGAAEVPSWPIDAPQRGASRAPQTVSTPNFIGSTFASDPGGTPPDTMGAVGPTQFIVTVNNRFRSFNKTTGVADGALDVSPDTFFSSVSISGTSDPRVRYDRLSGRWFIVMIDVGALGTGGANRVLVAVSSGNTITAASNFTFFQFTLTSGKFADYPSLGIDANALYIGGRMFNTALTSYLGADLAVVRKSSILGVGPLVVTRFADVGTGVAGMYTPQGADNPDPAAIEGYFIGVDQAVFSALRISRVSNPGGTPTLSPLLTLTVPTTSFPLAAPQSSGGTLDVNDDRLFAATLRGGQIWTAHSIAVTTAGVGANKRCRTPQRCALVPNRQFGQYAYAHPIGHRVR